MALTETGKKNLRKLRSILRAQQKQLSLHQSLHGIRHTEAEQSRGLTEFRDESGWIEDWQRRIETTEAKIAKLVAA